MRSLEDQMSKSISISDEEIIQKRIDSIENSLLRSLKDQIGELKNMSDEDFEKIKKIKNL